MANSTGKVVKDNEAVTSLKSGSKKELWMINTRSRGASSIHSNIQHSASHQDNQTKHYQKAKRYEAPKRVNTNYHELPPWRRTGLQTSGYAEYITMGIMNHRE